MLSVAAFVVLVFLNSQEVAKAKDQETKIAAKNTQWSKVASTAARVSQLKNKIGEYQNFTTLYPPMENFIQALAKRLPANMSLLTLDISNLGSVNLQARAPTAASAAQFVAVLNQESKVFSSVKILGITRAVDKEEYTISVSLNIAK